MEAPGRKMAHVAAEAGLFVAGFLVSFFTAGPALFADGAMGERFLAAAIESAAFLALGALAGVLAPSLWRANARWTTFGALVTPLFFTVVGRLWSQPSMLLLAAALAAGAAAGAHLGAWVGAVLRLRAGSKRTAGTSGRGGGEPDPRS